MISAIRARRRLPRILRRLPLPETGALPAGATLGYLNEVILPRDAWMHRLDIAEAVRRPAAWTPGEPEIVRQVVRDLAARWAGDGLALTVVSASVELGPFLLGRGPGAPLTADARDLCLLLSGRDHGVELSALPPSLAEHLLTSRVLF